MAATLANGGVNPVTGDAVIDVHPLQHVLAVMVTAGSTRIPVTAVRHRLPGKSGVSGGMITIAPGKGALATFSLRSMRPETASRAN